jgi:hypothetical protein
MFDSTRLYNGQDWMRGNRGGNHIPRTWNQFAQAKRVKALQIKLSRSNESESPGKCIISTFRPCRSKSRKIGQFDPDGEGVVRCRDAAATRGAVENKVRLDTYPKLNLSRGTPHSRSPGLRPNSAPETASFHLNTSDG